MPVTTDTSNAPAPFRRPGISISGTKKAWVRRAAALVCPEDIVAEHGRVIMTSMGGESCALLFWDGHTLRLLNDVDLYVFC